jgi:hypothetical protein
MTGHGFDLEATRRRIDGKLDGLGQKLGLVERRIGARPELLRVDLLQAMLGAVRETLGRARSERDAALDAIRGELDTLWQRIEALEE